MSNQAFVVILSQPPQQIGEYWFVITTVAGAALTTKLLKPH